MQHLGGNRPVRIDGCRVPNCATHKQTCATQNERGCSPTRQRDRPERKKREYRSKQLNTPDRRPQHRSDKIAPIVIARTITFGGARLRRSREVTTKKSTPSPVIIAPSPSPRKNAARTGICFSSGAATDEGTAPESATVDSRKGFIAVGGGDVTVLDRAESPTPSMEKLRLPPTGWPSADRTRQEAL